MKMTELKGRILATRDTTAHWNAKRRFIPLQGEIIIYTDHKTIKDEHDNDVYVPGVKIGDGNAYLVDLPFLVDEDVKEVIQMLRDHTENFDIHVTLEDKAFWNNKLNYQIVGENLIMNRN